MTYWLGLVFHILLETEVWSWASCKYEPPTLTISQPM